MKRRKKVKATTILAMCAMLLAVFGPSEAGAGRMFGGKTKPAPPKWCFCARVCAGFGSVAPSGFVPAGQSLGICPRVHEELIYDNKASCGCPQGTPLLNRQSVPPGTSPNR